MTKESKQTKTKTLFFLVALKGAILNGSTKSRCNIFLNFSYKEELSVFFFISFWFYWAMDWGHKSMWGFKITTFGMITVSLDMRIVNIFVFTAIWVCLNNTNAFGHCVTFSCKKVTALSLKVPIHLDVCLYYEVLSKCSHLAGAWWHKSNLSLGFNASISLGYNQGCGLRQIMRSPKVRNDEILGAQHLSWYE